MIIPNYFTTVMGTSFIVGVLIFCICIYIVAKEILSIYKRSTQFSYYPDLMIIFNHARTSAYQKVYRDYVMVFNSSGYKIDAEKVGELQHIYVQAVFVHCGSSVVYDLMDIYGSIDALTAILSSELIMNLDNEELTMKTMQDDDMQSTIEGTVNG